MLSLSIYKYEIPPGSWGHICFGDACYRVCPDPTVPQWVTQIPPLRGFIITYTCFLFLFLFLILILFLLLFLLLLLLLQMSHANMGICEHAHMNQSCSSSSKCSMRTWPYANMRQCYLPKVTPSNPPGFCINQNNFQNTKAVLIMEKSSIVKDENLCEIEVFYKSKVKPVKAVFF